MSRTLINNELVYTMPLFQFPEPLKPRTSLMRCRLTPIGVSLSSRHRISTAVAAFTRPAILQAVSCTLQRYCQVPRAVLIVISSESWAHGRGLVRLLRGPWVKRGCSTCICGKKTQGVIEPGSWSSPVLAADNTNKLFLQ